MIKSNDNCKEDTVKKKLIIIISVVVLLLVILCAAAVVLFSDNELAEGRAVACDNGEVVFVGEDGQFWQMNPSGLSKGQIAKLETGDKITVLKSTIMAMSYPGQCMVKLCFRTRSGDDGDIPESVLDELEGIGWITEQNISGADKVPEESKETQSGDAKPSVPSDEELEALINSRSDMPLDILQRLTVEEIYENEFEAGEGYYTIYLNESVYVDYDDGAAYEEYEWEFTLARDGEKSGWFVTEIYTNSPYSRFCGIGSGADAEKVKENYESLGFTVALQENTLVAECGRFTVRYTFRGANGVEIRLTAAVEDVPEEE